MAEGTVSVELSIEEQKALRAIASLQKRFEEFGEKASQSFKKSDLAFASFAGNLASTAITRAFSLTGSGISSLVGNIGDAVRSAAEGEKALNDFSVALAQTGKFSREAVDSFAEYADAIEKTTGISAEAILGASSFIQQINKLSNEDLKRATQATIDFSSALNIDLNSATKLVAKSIEGNTSALKEYGIEVKEGVTQSETLSNVLNGLSQFSGAAEGKIKTFSGSFELFKIAIDDFRKSIGEVIIQNPATVSVLQVFAKGAQELTRIIQENKVIINQLIAGALIPLVQIGSSSAIVVIELTDAFLRFKETLQNISTENALDGLRNQLRQLREESKFAFIDPNTGERLKTDYEKVLEVEIQAIEQSIQNQKNYAENRKKLFADIGNTVRNVENQITTSLNQGALDQASVQANSNTAFLESLNARNQIAVQKEQEQIEAISLLRLANKETEAINAQNDLLEKQLAADTNFQFLVENLGREEALREVARAKELQAISGQNAAVLSLRAARSKAEQNNIFAIQKYEDLSNKQRLDNLKSTFGTIATLQSSSSKELFMVGKAAALGTATIDGIQAVQKALASAPPPINYALAAAVGVATAANIAKIASQKPPKFADGGIVGGSSFSGDRIMARVNSGEMVLNRRQQSNLFNQIDGGGSGSIISAINSLGDRIANMTIIVQANSREIARLVRDERETGFAV